LGLFNDLQNEQSVVGNFLDIVMIRHFGTEDQKRDLICGRLQGKVRITFGLTDHNLSVKQMSIDNKAGQ